MSGKTERSAWWLALVGVIGVVAGALVTGAFNYLDHQRDLDAKLIELSVGILRAEPSQGSSPLREWAIDTIEKRAGFQFSVQQRVVLIQQQLPFGGGCPPSFGPAWGNAFGSGLSFGCNPYGGVLNPIAPFKLPLPPK